MDVTPSPVWREVLIVSGVSILNVFKNLFRVRRSSIGLHSPPVNGFVNQE